MLSFVDADRSSAYDVALELEDKLIKGPYPITYYQILGLNISCEKDEIDKNYRVLKNLMNNNSASFTLEEKKIIDEAYNCFTSILAYMGYEYKIKSFGAQNVKQQYDAMASTEKMFDNLSSKINQQVVVSYIENKNGQFIENKIVGNLDKCHYYNDVVIGCASDFVIDFLGEETAIIEICDLKGKQLYNNKYLLDENKRKLYDGSIDIINGFRIASWSFYKTRILDVYKQAKKGFSYKKKYSG